jgi:hypothetical protein
MSSLMFSSYSTAPMLSSFSKLPENEYREWHINIYVRSDEFNVRLDKS